MIKETDDNEIKALIRSALSEDIGTGDITTKSCIPKELDASAEIIAKEEGIICGLGLIDCIFEIHDKSIKIDHIKNDRAVVKKGEVVSRIKGNARSILSCERTIINLLQLMSGVATTSRRYADAVKGTKTKVLDTRKTIPCMRKLQKYAVRCGGCENHRQGLYDMVLIKDNHISVSGSISKAVKLSRAKNIDRLIEVECERIEQVEEALQTDCDWIMLDNMDVADMKKAIKMIHFYRSPTKKTKMIEASGGITLKNIKEIAELGVDFISVGALTHSYKSLDLSMKIKIHK